MPVAVEKAPAGVLAEAILRDKKTGAALKYTITDDWLPKVVEWNKTLDAAGHYDAALKAENLFQAGSR